MRASSSFWAFARKDRAFIVGFPARTYLRPLGRSGVFAGGTDVRLNATGTSGERGSCGCLPLFTVAFDNLPHSLASQPVHATDLGV